MKLGMGTAADAAAKLADGASKLKMVDKHVQPLNTLARSSLAFSDGATTVQV